MTDARTRRGKIFLTILVISVGAIASDVTSASAGLCIAFSYDGTGNRTARTMAPSTSTWGSAIWGCLSWTSQ